MSSSSKDKLPVLVLYGPTASGKTALVVEQLAGIAEIISADSRQVYRSLTIGTAKPSLSEQRIIPHHLIDVCSVEEQYTAGRFVAEANVLIPEILSRGRLPIICGGTGYYIRSFLYGMPDCPPADPIVRDRVRLELIEVGLEGLFQKLNHLDPVRAAELALADSQRICRALEIIYQTGEKASLFSPKKELCPHLKAEVFRIERHRDALYHRINQRTAVMMRDGLPLEVATLRDTGRNWTLPGMRTIGYAEFELLETGDLGNLEEVQDLIAKNTRNYAKRQMTFAKSFKMAHILNPDNGDSVSILQETAKRLLDA